MITKQNIILLSCRDDFSEWKISHELGINRETVRRYLAEYRKSKDKQIASVEPEEVPIEEIVKPPR